jgi:hypothetical protein
MIEKELKNFLDAMIVIPLGYSEWVGDLVLVRKKIGRSSSVWILQILIKHL